MREEQLRIKHSRISFVALVMPLMLALLFFSGPAQALTHSGLIAEFTLGDLPIESVEFSLARQWGSLSPMSVEGIRLSTSKSTTMYSEIRPLYSGNKLEKNSKSQREIVLSKPPLKQGKVVGEFIAGAALGMVMGIGAAYIGGTMTYDGSWFSEMPGAVIGLALAYPLGSALGVYFVGDIGSTTGSFTSALGAAYGGLIVGTAGAYALNGMSGNASIVAFLVAPPLLATIAFNKTRRYKDPSLSRVSLLNFRRGKLDLAFPAIMAFPSAQGLETDWLVNLATVEF